MLKDEYKVYEEKMRKSIDSVAVSSFVSIFGKYRSFLLLYRQS